MRNYRLNKGYSTIEMLVTIIVASLFVISITTIYITVSQASAKARYRSTADDLAYSYLRKYVSTGSTPSDWFVCDTASGSANTNDLMINPNAAGQLIDSGSLNGNDVGLIGSATYQVRAYAMFGCNGANADKPIKVESTVTYDSNNYTVRHAALVGY